MELRAGTRKRVATWMVGVLLLAQWLVSAYACPPTGPVGAGQAVAITSAVLHDCHGAAEGAEGAVEADPGNLALCKAHCQVGDQAANPGSDANLLGSLLPVLGGVAFDLPLLPAATAAGCDWPSSGAPPPGWPPLYLVHQALRN